jgi:hypothetical protein
MTKLVIVTLILLATGGVAIFITMVWPLIPVTSGQSPSQTDPWDVVNNLHVAINSSNANDVLALFSNSATITDNRSVINDPDHIRKWVLYSRRMAGLHLKMFHTEMDGEKLIWLDTAHNGPEGQNRNYILRWEAVIAEGKIQSLVVIPRYMPDLNREQISP